MPANGDGPVSSLRLLNDGHDTTVTVSGIDERGNRSGTVYIELAAGTGRTLTARELTAGGEGLTGRLRVGAGMWELQVTASHAQVTVVNLLEDAAGRITNLSPPRYYPVAEVYR